MYYLATALVAVLSVLHVLAQTSTTLSWDNNYDNGDLSLDSVACSDGVNGIKTRYPKYTTLGSLPNFPNVTAAYTVEAWNSMQCGACYAVKYRDAMVHLLAVDRDQTGFTSSQKAMNSLTDGQAFMLGRVDVTFTQVHPSACGLE